MNRGVDGAPAEQAGVKKGALVASHLSTGSLAILYCGIFLLAMSTSTESQATFTLNPYITSAFQVHTLLSTVSIVSNLLSTVLKAPIAKLADVFGRLEVLIAGIVAFILGYICIANSRHIATYFLSQILYSVGSNSCMLIIQLVIADTSSLHNRALLASLPTAPFLAAVWLGPWLGEKFLRGVGWRWGVGVWSIILPIAALPLISVLGVNQYRSLKAERLSETSPSDLATREIDADADTEMRGTGWGMGVVKYLVQLDLAGSLLFTAGLSMVLLPLTLANQEERSWRDPGIVTSLVLGPIVLVGFVWFEYRWAKFPIVSVHVMKQKVLLAGCFAAVFFFATFYIFDVYQTSYFQVVNGVSPAQAGYINNVYAFGSTAVSICVGLCIKYLKRVRPFILVGSVCFLVGIVVLVVTVERHYGVPMVVLAMALYAAGSGAFAMPAQTAVQSVCHKQDVGAVTALFLTCTMLGGSIGSAISGAMWPYVLLKNLRNNLPTDVKPFAQEIANDLSKALAYPWGSPARDAINDAYRTTYRRLVYFSLATAIIFTISTWFIKCEDLDTKHHDAPASIAESDKSTTV